MSASDRHYEICNKIRDLLGADAETGFSDDDVRVEDFPFTNEPEFGIAVSPIGETEAVGTNERDDIGYICQLTRCLHNLGDDGLQTRSQWRVRARLLFHRRRLGLTDCELITRVEFGQIAVPSHWSKRNVDASIVRVICYVRESRMA